MHHLKTRVRSTALWSAQCWLSLFGLLPGLVAQQQTLPLTGGSSTVLPYIFTNCNPPPGPAGTVSGNEVTFTLPTITCGGQQASGTVTLSFPGLSNGTLTGAPGQPPANPLGQGSWVPSSPLTINTRFSVTAGTGQTILIGATVYYSNGALCGGNTFPRTAIPAQQVSAVWDTCGPLGSLYQDPSSKAVQANVELNIVFAPVSAPKSPTGVLSFQFSAVFSTSNIDLDSYEFVQVTQRLDHSVPLLKNKATKLRVYPKSTGTQPVRGVTAKLCNDDQSICLQPDNGPVTAQLKPNRGNLGDSLLYTLPPGLLKADHLNLSGALTASGASAKTISVGADFLSSTDARVTGLAPFSLAYMPICLQNTLNSGGKPLCPPVASLAQNGELVAKIFPFLNGNFIYFQLPVPDISVAGDPDALQFPPFDVRLAIKLLKYFRLLNMYVTDFDHLAAWLPAIENDRGRNLPLVDLNGLWSEDLLRAGALPPYISWGNAQAPMGTLLKLPGYLLAHSVGHRYGLQDHANDLGDYGFDAETNRIWDPVYSYDFMYSSPHTYGSDAWIAPDSYAALLNQEHPTAAPAAIVTSANQAPRQEVPQPAASSVEYLVIGGTARRDGTGASLDPGYRVFSTQPGPPSTPSGNHCLQFSGAAGVLGKYCFNLQVDPPAGIAPVPDLPFVVVAPWMAGATQVALLRGSQQLASMTASKSAPAVTIGSPHTGDKWQGTNTISWSSSATGGNALMHTVLYSSDGGGTWLPISVDTADTSTTFDTAQINGGSNVRFRVLASDGLNTGSADVGPITVTQNPHASVAGTLDFGNAGPGQAIERTLPVANSGSGPLVISRASVDDNKAFTVVSPTPITVQTRSQGFIRVSLSVPGAGTVSGTLTLSTNDTTQPTTRVLLTAKSSTSPTPSIQVLADTLDFGDVDVSTSADLGIVISNGGLAPLTVSAITRSNPAFTLTAPALPFTVAAADLQPVTIHFKPASAGPQTATLTIATNDPTHPATTVSLQGNGTTPAANSAPQIGAGGIVNGASFQAPLVRGELATIFGANLAGGIAQANTLPLPVTLGGAQVTVGGIPAPLFYVSPGQINFQVPFESPITGNVQVVATRDGTPSTAQTAAMAEYAPGVFTYARNATTVDPVIVHLNNTLVTPSSPAAANEVLVVYATGAGSFDVPPATGAASSGSPVATAKVTPTVTVGGVQAQVQFAGLTPGLVGLLQINIKLPASLPATGTLPLVVQFGSSSSPSVNLNVAGQPGNTTPVAWWKFNEGSGTAVSDAINGNTGMLSGSATWGAGLVNGALTFDGNGSKVTGLNPGNGFPLGSSPRTVCAWIKVVNPPSADNGILHYGTAGSGVAGTNFHLFLRADGTAGLGNGYGFGTIAGSKALGDGKWHHLAGTYEGPGTNLARIYVDGVLDSSGTLSSVPNTLAGSNWTIGAFMVGSTTFRGSIGDVRIYDRALSSAEVGSLAAAGSSGN